MALRVTALVSIAVLAATALYAVHDRSHLAAEIRGRQASYASCVRAIPRGTKAAVAKRCGWSNLVEARRGDLLGLPFFALAVVLILILVVRITIGKPEPAAGGIDVSSTVVPE